MISQKIDQIVREVPDFPKSGINFKDITSLLLDAELKEDGFAELPALSNIPSFIKQALGL